MKVLLHTCCAPCTIYPLRILRETGCEPVGYFFNPNIHPSLEYRRRAETLAAYAQTQALPMLWAEGYAMEAFFRAVAGREDDRCRHCYTLRLAEAARMAKVRGCGGFTTTLLYSKFQKHDLIRELGDRVGQENGIPFVYRDFREGWQEGVRVSREIGMYRQPYCGCLYSEKERYGRRPLAPGCAASTGAPA